MTEAEITQLVMYVRGYKPNAFAFQSNLQQELTILAWQRKLHTFSLETAIDAVDSYFENPENRRGSNPPMPDDIKDQIMMDKNPELSINLDESFSLVNKKILQIAPTPLYTAEKGEIAPEDRIRETLNELEWEAVSMLGGHRRFREATASELPFLRKDYKDMLSSLIAQAKQGTFTAKYDDQPTLDEMNKAALEAQERGIDTAKFRAMIKGLIDK